MTSISTTNTGTFTTGTTTDTTTAFWSAAIDEAADTPVSFDRCCDWLLDLYQSTTDDTLRHLITDVLADLRALGPIEAELEDVVLGALASVEVAFEIAAGR